MKSGPSRPSSPRQMEKRKGTARVRRDRKDATATDRHRAAKRATEIVPDRPRRVAKVIVPDRLAMVNVRRKAVARVRKVTVVLKVAPVRVPKVIVDPKAVPAHAMAKVVVRVPKEKAVLVPALMVSVVLVPVVLAENAGLGPVASVPGLVARRKSCAI